MEKKKLAVCFSDLTNFTKLMQEFDDEQAIAILQEVTEQIGDIIVKFGGKIRKYIGDSILFTFAEPKNAVKAVQEIATIQKAVGSLILQVHASCATGEVFEIDFGHKSLKLSDIFGETVNQAAILLRKAAQSDENFALCPESAKYL